MRKLKKRKILYDYPTEEQQKRRDNWTVTLLTILFIIMYFIPAIVYIIGK